MKSFRTEDLPAELAIIASNACVCVWGGGACMGCVCFIMRSSLITWTDFCKAIEQLHECLERHYQECASEYANMTGCYERGYVFNVTSEKVLTLLFLFKPFNYIIPCYNCIVPASISLDLNINQKQSFQNRVVQSEWGMCIEETTTKSIQHASKTMTTIKTVAGKSL